MQKVEDCRVCYTNFDDSELIILSCNCKFCPDCLTSWMIEQINDESRTKMYYSIKCMNSCGRTTDALMLMDYLPPENRNKINQIFFNNYLVLSEDIQKCPKKSCNYAGVLPTTEECGSEFQCELCDAQWMHSESSFLITEWSSSIWKFLFTKNCPQCDVRIQKIGGCSVMTCDSCKERFCWRCLQSIDHHNRILCLSYFFKENFLWLVILGIFLWTTGITNYIITMTISLITNALVFLSYFFNEDAVTVYCTLFFSLLSYLSLNLVDESLLNSGFGKLGLVLGFIFYGGSTYFLFDLFPIQLSLGGAILTLFVFYFQCSVKSRQCMAKMIRDWFFKSKLIGSFAICLILLTFLISKISNLYQILANVEYLGIYFSEIHCFEESLSFFLGSLPAVLFFDDSKISRKYFGLTAAGCYMAYYSFGSYENRSFFIGLIPATIIGRELFLIFKRNNSKT